jgi:hypothetical protein
MATSQHCAGKEKEGISHPLAADGNFQEKSWNVLEPQVVQNYKKHTSYVDKSERMLKAMVYTAEFQENETCLFFY